MYSNNRCEAPIVSILQVYFNINLKKLTIFLNLGLTLVLDAEHYDYGYFPRGARGFRVALSAATDQAIINQDGFYISPGQWKCEPKSKLSNMNKRHFML